MEKIALNHVLSRYSAPGDNHLSLSWLGDWNQAAVEQEPVREELLHLDQPVWVVQKGAEVGIVRGGEITSYQAGEAAVLAMLPALLPSQLGDPAFTRCYGLQYAYYAGAMANAIASTEMVIALGKAGFLGSFGAAGLPPARLEAAIQTIQAALSAGPYAFNLIHSPNETGLERRVIELYLRYGVRVVEASAFLDLSPNIVWYRAAGLVQDPTGKVQIQNRIIAKVSRHEVAAKFMKPAPAAMLAELVREQKITQQQADLAQLVPMADDVTVEADSGGHTDNRPLVCLMPAMIALRDEVQEKYQYEQPVRVGAAGGISTPAAVLAAFSMGAAYVVTGTVNQACVESGACEHTRSLLAKASLADVMMAPSADMFEMGVKVQVLKTGTMFAMRAQKLYELYMKYDAIEQIPAEEREKLERQVFKRSLDSVWEDTAKFFSERDPEQLAKANASPKRKMALVFRWYLGLSSRWSAAGEKGRELDYQVWCGPSIGPFNDWTRGSYLAEAGNRGVVDVALHLMTGAAYQWRINALTTAGIQVTSRLATYYPRKKAG